MPNTNQNFQIRRQKVASVVRELPAKVVPQSKSAKVAKWLLEQTNHKVVHDRRSEVIQMGHIPGSDVEQLLQTFMGEYECSLVWEAKLDRILIGEKQYIEMLHELPPWHSFAFSHALQMYRAVPVREAFRNYDDSNMLSRICNVYIQVLPNVEGILFVPKMSF